MTTTHSSKKTAEHTNSTAPSTAAASPSTTPTGPLVSFPTPPEISSLQAAPSGFVGGSLTRFRGVVPFEAEVAALPAAIKDLQKLPNASLFVGAPPLAYFIQLLILAGEWTAVRNASASWDTYAATQEGNIWGAARPLVDDFRSSLTQVLKAEPQLGSQLQGLTTFLGIRSAAAKQAAATRRANTKSEQKGERATHGKVGKKNLRAAEKAALAAADAANAAAPTPTTQPAASPATPTAAQPSTPRVSPSN